MIRPFGKLILALGVVALAAAPASAQAQKGRGFGFGMGGGAGFLMAPNVQKDLKLSDEQVGKVQDTLREVFEKHADEFRALRDLDQQERQQKAATLNKEMNDDVKKALGLSDAQSKRFDQISLQARGLMAFADPTVQEKVKLTADQKSQIREIQQQSFANLRGAFSKDASPEEQQAARAKMREAQAEAVKKAEALLTDDQKKEWKGLIGDRIEIQAPRRSNN